MRWLILAVLAVFVLPGDADAQAFKPRGGSKATPAKKAAPAKKATPAKKKKASAPKKASKRPSRAAETSGRPDNLTPDEDDAPPKRGRDEDSDDYVLIEDD